MTAALLIFGVALAQSASFDVASVKAVEATEDLYRANLGTVLHGEVELTNATLSDCLKFAHGYSSDEQIEGPEWIKNKGVRFNIQAKSPPDTPRPQSLLMLQRLLAERFQLTLHKERKTRSYAALSIGKKGLKMQPALADAPVNKSNNGLGHIVSPHLSMPALALLLSRFLRQAVIDQTGLDGFYDVHLEWTPEDLHATNSAIGTDTLSGPTVYTAIAEQLGLRLDSRKGPLEILIVDHAEKSPLPN